ncbi:MAG: 2-hydroxyacid dehydrogenase [Chloroflexota bacterium]|nr:2-hydroxyacid dehydrogenase [Chloroflexota bacterium]
MGKIIAITATKDTDLDRIYELVPPDIELKRIDVDEPISIQSQQMSGVVALLHAGRPYEKFDTELARLCPSLRLVQTTSAGVDRFDVTELAELGVKVANNNGGNSIAVAEHTISLMVSVYRKLSLQFASVAKGDWMGEIRQSWGPKAHEVAGKTVGVVGLGHIGSKVARRLMGWECSVIFHDPDSDLEEISDEMNIESVSLDELLTSSDVVSLHVPLNASTRGMIGDEELGKMKPTAILINTCRGPVVDEQALISALKSGKIAGAGLDVLEQEPSEEDNPLLEMENVAITPHLAGMSIESGPRSANFAIENLVRVTRGQEPLSVVPPV